MQSFNGTSLLVTAVLATAGFTTMAMGQAANDECSTATVVTAGVPVAYSTTTATSSADAAPNDAQCAGTYLTWGTANPDVWFRYTATGDGLASFSTCDPAGYDTSIVLYTGTCAALTQIACNGDATANAGCQQFHSEINGVSVTTGSSYYIRAGGYQGGVGAATMTVTFAPSAAGCAGTTGGCGVVHATPGCSDPVCCSAVCAANPLCCEIGWDETCVQGAVAACGIFVYSCVTPVAANDCATNATVVAGDAVVAFNNALCNTDGPNHPAATCSSGNDLFLNDVWYRARANANGTMLVNTCGQVNFDSKLAIYDMGTNPAIFDYNTLNLPTVLVACNDDGSAACTANGVFASELSINAVNGHWYLIRVATFDIAGSGTVTIDMPAPCALPAQTGVEAEPCGSATNNGCNALGESEDLLVGSRIKGTFATFTNPTTGANTRDTDFYKIVVPTDASVTVNIYSASFVTGLILSGDIATAACAGISVTSTASGNCPATVTSCLNPGTYYIFVAPTDFVGIPCGSGVANEYVLEVTSAAAQCPDIIDTVCQAPGPDSRSSAVSMVGSGNFAQGCATGCTATGGNTDCMWASSFSGATLPKEISCVNFGVAALRSEIVAGVCGYYTSDLAIPMQLSVYRDLDGGAPRNVIVTAGDGNDLQLIDFRDINVPGGLFVGNVDFTPPLCVENETTVVIVLSTPNLFQVGAPGVPVGSGYRAGVALSAAPLGTPTNLWLRYTVCTGAGLNVFTPTAYVTATNALQWPIELNGTVAACSGANNCPTDLNADGITGSADLSVLLNGWGTASPDLNGDGVVGSADLSVMLNGWGACP